MGAQSSATPRHSIGYLEKDVRETIDAAKERELERDYLSEAVTHGEPPPVAMGAGAADLGLAIGQVIPAETAEKTWTELAHPITGERLGQRKAHYPGPGERLARAAVARGIDLPSELEPAAIR